ncbi:hypothetical protein V1511DRAFT_518314 [Dipodascopsis uninucleata]
MPIAKSLKKVEKKTKNSSAVHPRARKFKQLNKATLREKKLMKQKNDRDNAREAKLFRLKTFRNIIDRLEHKRKQVFTEMEMKGFIEEFIARDDQELDKLKSERRPGRPTSTRQDYLQARRDLEAEEYATGFYSPNLLEQGNVDLFRRWNMEYSGIGLLKYVRISKEGGLQVGTADDSMMTSE